MSTLAWVIIGGVCIFYALLVIFVISLGKAAKEGDEAFRIARVNEHTITSGSPVTKE